MPYHRTLPLFVLTAPLVALLVVFGGCGGEKESSAEGVGPSAGPVRPVSAAVSPAAAPNGAWVKAVRGEVKDYVPAVGSFRARRITQIGSQVSGRVEEVLVDVGDVVKKDQVLVRLDPVFFDIEVAQARAKLEAAKAALADAELNYRRMKNLWDKPTSGGPPSVSRKLYDDAKLRVDATTADHRQAVQAVRYAEQRRKETEVRAPYDAVVCKRLVDPGEPVTAAPATYLLVIQEVGTLDLEFSLPQSLLSIIRVGTPVEFEVEGISDGKGVSTIAIIFPAVDEATRSVHCRAYVPNPGLKYRPGLLAQVRVLSRAVHDALVVPRPAVTQTATGWQVLVSNDGHPVPRAVSVGVVTEDRVEVTGGLEKGAEVFVPAGN